MRPEDSPQIKYERLQRQLQQEVLKNYPNPERKGCPGEAVVRTLVARPMEESIEGDPNWQHVTHCSECYREFLAFKAALDKRKSRRKDALRWSFAGAAIVAAFAIFLLARASFHGGSKRPQNAELAYVPRTIVMKSTTRSARGAAEEEEPFSLERGRVALTVQLPIGSRAGKYEFQLGDESDHAVLKREAEADIKKGITSFLVLIDLSGSQAGRYKVEVRQPPYDWDYYPVILR